MSEFSENRWFIIWADKRPSFPPPHHSPGSEPPDAGRPLPCFQRHAFVCERKSDLKAFSHSDVYFGFSASLCGQRREIVFKVISLQCSNHGPSMSYANVHVAKCTDVWFQRAVQAEPCVVNEKWNASWWMTWRRTAGVIHGGIWSWHRLCNHYTCWVAHKHTSMHIYLAWILEFSPRSTPFSRKENPVCFTNWGVLFVLKQQYFLQMPLARKTKPEML